jgi:hypothetical protein
MYGTLSHAMLQVIIDNMMNLDIFFTMEALTGNHTYRNMATSYVVSCVPNPCIFDLNFASGMRTRPWSTTFGLTMARTTS